MINVRNTAIIFLFMFAISEHFAQAEPIQASRPPEAGCTWKQYEFKELGIRLLFEDCNDPRRHYELSMKDGWLEQHRPSDDVIFGSHKIVRTFSKPAEQSIKDAIKKSVVENIQLDNKSDEREARESCQVVSSHVSLPGNKITLTIMPTGNYKKKIDKELEEAPRDFGCGAYGAQQATTYFEYHPLESKTTYAFIVFGFDRPLFDENSIEFFDK